MTHQRNDQRFWHFFRDTAGLRRRYGIYVPTIDRFIHISGYDVWSSLETAEILTSKVQTAVFVLPAGYVKLPEYIEIISNENCCNWGIRNKLDLKVGTSNVLIARQTPSIGMLYSDDVLEEHSELPEDLKENPNILKRLKQYVDYVYPRVLAINLATTCFNPYYSRKFMDKYLDQAWNVTNKNDPSQSERGLDFDIKNIMYRADSAEESENEIIKYWQTNHWDIAYIMAAYYRILGAGVPEVLKPLMVENQHVNHSIFIM